MDERIRERVTIDVYAKYVGYTPKLEAYANLFAYRELGVIGFWNFMHFKGGDMNWTIIIAVAIPVVVALIAYIISPWLSYKRELKRIYEAPFRRDCAFFYGEACEFYERYLIPLVSSQIPGVSSVQKIDDFLALHESQINIPRWLGRIKKEKGEIAEKIWNFADTIDRLWHIMEDQFRIQKLSSRGDILALAPQKREEIAEFLIESLKNEANELEPIAKEILTYFYNKIP